MFSSTYRSIAGNAPANKELVATSYPRMTAPNFLKFLQALRAQDGAEDIIISAAVSITTFVGFDGNPMSDVSGFADVLDYIGTPSPTSALSLTFV